MSMDHLDRMRPRFERRIQLAPEQVRELLASRVDGGECGVGARIAKRHVDLSVAKQNRKIYSPVLTLEIEPTEDGAVIHGNYHPAPNLWTFFMFLYAFLAFAAVVSLVGGTAQWMLQGQAWGFWGLPACAVLAVGVYLASQIGQTMGARQMHCLGDFVDEAIREQDVSAQGSETSGNSE
ncbi:MAG: hypothetical protein VX899_25040 [Myxococcota bacterium]|nr:hypothetical protein [Myxococcota bacterium]